MALEQLPSTHWSQCYEQLCGGESITSPPRALKSSHVKPRWAWKPSSPKEHGSGFSLARRPFLTKLLKTRTPCTAHPNIASPLSFPWFLFLCSSSPHKTDASTPLRVRRLSQHTGRQAPWGRVTNCLVLRGVPSIQDRAWHAASTW